MRHRRRLRTGIPSIIGAVALLVLGQGVAAAAEGSATLDDPIGAIADVVDDTTGTVTDIVDDTTDAITDTVDDTTDAITDTVENTTDAITDTVENTTGTVTDIVDDTTGTVTDTVASITGGVESDPAEDGDAAEGTGAGTAAGSESTSGAAGAAAPRRHEGALDTRALTSGPSDLDELAQGGNAVVEGSGGATCVGIADVVCLDLVGGLGALGILFRAVEEARDVVSAFADSLASTGRDLWGATVMLVMLTLAGIALTSRRRRPSAPPARTRALVKT
jgi:gas vesicle protein